MSIQLLHGDCRELLKSLPDQSIDSIVTDPPYELGFMGKRWDASGIAYDIKVWQECLRVLKPGGHLLAFGGTRTYHRMTCAIEDAGFEIRDCIMWVYGSGFPKSLDVSKAIDKAAGAEREVVGVHTRHGGGSANSGSMSGPLGTASELPLTAPATEAAKQWQGWGSALKPSHEPVVWAKKPLNVVPSNVMLEAQTNIGAIICQSLSHAKTVESLLASSLREYDTGSVSALLIAAVKLGYMKQEEQEKTGMFKSLEIEKIILNIVGLWNRILDANYRSQSMCITSTATSLTTALRIFKSLISQITPATIIEGKLTVFGEILNATIASEYLREQTHKLDLQTIVQEIVTATKEKKPVSNAEFYTAVQAANSVLQNAMQIIEENQPRISPAVEPIVVARKPIEGTIAENVLAHGTGAINVDGCRVETSDALGRPYGGGNAVYGKYSMQNGIRTGDELTGRWPANLIHDGSDEVVELFPQTVSMGHRPKTATNGGIWGNGKTPSLADESNNGYGDKGSAARFFYCAKTSPSERGDNNHPTVKPLALMRYLCRLVTPPRGTVLDPFAGSGSTMVAARQEGFDAVGCELEAAHIEIIKRRLQMPAEPEAEQEAQPKRTESRSTQLRLF